MGRPNLSRETRFSGAYEDRKKRLPCSADHEQDWQPYPVDPYSATCDDHTNVPDSAWVRGMSGLTRDGTTVPVSRNQILRRERGQGKNVNVPCSADHVQDP